MSTRSNYIYALYILYQVDTRSSQRDTQTFPRGTRSLTSRIKNALYPPSHHRNTIEQAMHAHLLMRATRASNCSLINLRVSQTEARRAPLPARS